MHSVVEFLSKQSILGPNKTVELVFSEISKILGWMREMDINFHEEYFRQNDYFVTLLVFSQYIIIIINERMSVVNADVMIVVEII